MFHFPHVVDIIEKPTGADGGYGRLGYIQVSNNVTCQFLGRPRESHNASAFGDVNSIDAMFSFPGGTAIEVDWRLVFSNVAYIVVTVNPEMNLQGVEQSITVNTRREKVIDGATHHSQT